MQAGVEGLGSGNRSGRKPTQNTSKGQALSPWCVPAEGENTVVGLSGDRLRDWHGSHSPLGGHPDGVEFCVYRSTGAQREVRSNHAKRRLGNLREIRL